LALTAASAELNRAGDPRAHETHREAAEFAGRNQIRAA
jgi:hypothetical protein